VYAQVIGRKCGVSRRCFSNALHRFLFLLRSLCIMVGAFSPSLCSSSAVLQEIVYADIEDNTLDTVRMALPISKQRRHDVYQTVAVQA